MMSSHPSLHRIVGELLVNKLTNAMPDYEATASFSYGGYIGIHKYQDTTRYGDFTSTRKPVTSPAINIRWDVLDSNVSRKITFPVSNGKEEVLEELVKDCKPATSGLDGKDVLDETIRKAGKLEASEFSTSFNPYDFGIVDAIAQALLPSIVRPEGKTLHIDRCGVVTELYKLNVYSGPSGKFKPHVDTPRGFTCAVSFLLISKGAKRGKCKQTRSAELASSFCAISATLDLFPLSALWFFSLLFFIVLYRI